MIRVPFPERYGFGKMMPVHHLLADAIRMTPLGWRASTTRASTTRASIYAVSMLDLLQILSGLPGGRRTTLDQFAVTAGGLEDLCRTDSAIITAYLQAQPALRSLPMASVNKVILLGNCGRDPEIRYLPSGQAVANVSIATSSRRKDRNTGESVEDTQWHRVTFYDRLAEIVGEYVRKGQPVYVEGRLKYGKYTDQAGVEKNTVDIIATEMQLLGKREGMGNPDDDSGAPRRPAPTSRNAPPAAQTPAKSSTGFDDMDDDIPF
jgi:single-strand DNA-binding protein